MTEQQSIRSEAEESPTRSTRVVILTALQLEYSAVRKHLIELVEETHTSGTVYEKGVFQRPDGTPIHVGIVEIGAGNTGAAVEAERAISYFAPEVIFFVGVAGGLKDVSLGDVVVATKVYGYDSGKAKQAFEARPDVRSTSYRMEQRARAEAKKVDWLARIPRRSAKAHPRVKVGPIAAGDKVVASTRSAIARFLRKQYGDAIAVEMEGRGFLEAAHVNQQVEAVVVRGVSDLIDAKRRADSSGSQEIAAHNAAAFAFEILAKLDLDFTSGSPPAAVLPAEATSSSLPSEIQPPTVTVDPGGKGDYTSIKDAIANIGAGERILVKRGLYQEDLVIEKSIELVGDGLPGEVVIQSEGIPTLIFRASLGRVSNIYFRQIGKGLTPCVEILQGRLELEACDISGNGSSAVLIRSGSDPRLRWNLIHDNVGAGIVITNNGRGIIEENKIASCRGAGIEIIGGASPTVRSNEIRDGATAGIFIHDGGLGSIQRNSIFGNKTGIFVSNSAFPTIEGNQIYDNGDEGVSLNDDCRVLLTFNSIYRQGTAISISSASATIRRNTIKHCGYGIHVYSSGQVAIEANNISRLGYTGVLISGSTATVSRNYIHDCSSFAISFGETAKGVIEDNKISRLAISAITIKNSSVDVRRNKISYSDAFAVCAEDGSDGWIEDNYFFNNVLGGVNKSDESQMSLNSNREEPAPAHGDDD